VAATFFTNLGREEVNKSKRNAQLKHRRKRKKLEERKKAEQSAPQGG
jgi:hypothetical protein